MKQQEKPLYSLVLAPTGVPVSCLRTAFRLSTLEPHGNRDVDFFQENQPPPERNHTRTYLYIWLSEKHPNHNKENERNFSSPSASIARHTFTVSRGLAANGVASAHFFFCICSRNKSKNSRRIRRSCLREIRSLRPDRAPQPGQTRNESFD